MDETDMDKDQKQIGYLVFMDVKMDFGNRIDELKSAYGFEITK